MTDHPTGDAGGTAAGPDAAQPPVETTVEVEPAAAVTPGAEEAAAGPAAEAEQATVDTPPAAEAEAEQTVDAEPTVADSPVERTAAPALADVDPVVLEPNTGEPVTAELAVEEPEAAEAVATAALEESSPEPAPEPEPEPELGLQPSLEPTPTPEPEAEPTSEADPTPEPDAAADAAEPTPEADPTPEPDAATKAAEPTPEADPTPEPDAATDAAEPTPEPEPATDAASHPPVPHPPAHVPAAPVVAPAAATVVAHPPVSTGPPPESFGRVEDDGTVWVRTAEGEVTVGQFQAGSPDEALAYYARKYTALETEVVLLEQRLAGGADVAVDEAAATVERISAALATPQVVGDIDGLRARVAALTPALESRRAAARAAKSRAREAAKAAREAIVVEAEGLADSTSWKSSGDRLRVLLDEWKVAPRVDRGTEQALWKRFSAARNSFDRRRRAHFAKLSGDQSEAKAAKTALVKEAEALSTSTDWAATATQFRGLMDRWKAVGRASRTDDDALWARFRAAQDTFFSARSAAFDERDAGQADNLLAKEALATEAEALLPLGDLNSAKSSLRDIQERWEKVGHVPRGDKERVEGRLRRVEQAIREAEESKWKRTNPEARARAEATVELLTTAMTKLNKTLASATAAGDTKKIAETTEALEARQAWLDEAQRALTEFSGS